MLLCVQCHRCISPATQGCKMCYCLTKRVSILGSTDGPCLVPTNVLNSVPIPIYKTAGPASFAFRKGLRLFKINLQGTNSFRYCWIVFLFFFCKILVCMVWAQTFEYALPVNEARCKPSFIPSLQTWWIKSNPAMFLELSLSGMWWYTCGFKKCPIIRILFW